VPKLTNATKKKAVIGAIVLIAGIVFARTVVLAFFYFPESDGGNSANSTSSTATGPAVPGSARGNGSPTSASAHADSPVRLIIPSLNINASVQYVGVNAEGNMRAPSNFTDVAWYEYGAAPGEIGSAVIDGHVDNGLGLNGVFKHLNSLAVGDDIYVVARSGARLHFVVSDVELYPYNAAPSDLIFSRADAAWLNLITCDGAWVSGQRTYDHRLVVFAKLAG